MENFPMGGFKMGEDPENPNQSFSIVIFSFKREE